MEVARGSPADELSTSAVLLDNGAGRRLSLVERRPSYYENQVSLLTGGQPVPLALPPKADVEAMVGNQVLVSLRQDWTVGGTTFRSGSRSSISNSRYR